MKRLAATMVLGVLAMLGASRVGADSPAVLTANGVDSNVMPELAGMCVFGWSFSIGAQDVQVNALGFYDNGPDGLSYSRQVGIWNSGGDLLAQVTIPSGTSATLVGKYRYGSIGAITLAAGQTYVVGALYFAPINADPYLASYSVQQSFNPNVTFLNARSSNCGAVPSFRFPDLVDSYFGTFGPNLMLVDNSPVQLQSFEVE